MTGVQTCALPIFTGKTAQLCGMAASSVASKMSMVIPITAGFVLYHESLDIQKIIGLIFALPAVLLTGSANIDAKGESKATKKQMIVLPLL